MDVKRAKKKFATNAAVVSELGLQQVHLVAVRLVVERHHVRAHVPHVLRIVVGRVHAEARRIGPR